MAVVVASEKFYQYEELGDGLVIHTITFGDCVEKEFMKMDLTAHGTSPEQLRAYLRGYDEIRRRLNAKMYKNKSAYVTDDPERLEAQDNDPPNTYIVVTARDGEKNKVIGGLELRFVFPFLQEETGKQNIMFEGISGTEVFPDLDFSELRVVSIRGVVLLYHAKRKYILGHMERSGLNAAIRQEVDLIDNISTHAGVEAICEMPAYTPVLFLPARTCKIDPMEGTLYSFFIIVPRPGQKIPAIPRLSAQDQETAVYLGPREISAWPEGLLSYHIIADAYRATDVRHLISIFKDFCSPPKGLELTNNGFVNDYVGPRIGSTNTVTVQQPAEAGITRDLLTSLIRAAIPGENLEIIGWDNTQQSESIDIWGDNSYEPQDVAVDVLDEATSKKYSICFRSCLRAGPQNIQAYMYSDVILPPIIDYIRTNPLAQRNVTPDFVRSITDIEFPGQIMELIEGVGIQLSAIEILQSTRMKPIRMMNERGKIYGIHCYEGRGMPGDMFDRLFSGVCAKNRQIERISELHSPIVAEVANVTLDGHKFSYVITEEFNYTNNFFPDEGQVQQLGAIVGAWHAHGLDIIHTFEKGQLSSEYIHRPKGMQGNFCLGLYPDAVHFGDKIRLRSNETGNLHDSGLRVRDLADAIASFCVEEDGSLSVKKTKAFLEAYFARALSDIHELFKSSARDHSEEQLFIAVMFLSAQEIKALPAYVAASATDLGQRIREEAAQRLSEQVMTTNILSSILEAYGPRTRIIRPQPRP